MEHCLYSMCRSFTLQAARMNQDEDNGVIPDTEERPRIDIKEEEVFTTESPADIKVEKQPKLLSCKVCFQCCYLV